MSAARILIADDQADVRLAARLALQGAGHQVLEVIDAAAVEATLRAQSVDLLLLDLNFRRDTTSGEEGLSLIRRLRSAGFTLPIVVITAWGNVPLAVRALQDGAQDFLEKPWDNQRLNAVVQARLQEAARSETRLDPRNDSRIDPRHATPASTPEQAPDLAQQLVAHSPLMRELLRLAGRVAASDARVLLTGENGTGKSLLAQHLHALSARAAGPIVSVNLGAVPETLFESELFGHRKGAFTDARDDRVGRFELAEGGTLFLDEIGTLPLALQPKLLRVLETGEYERVGDSRSRRADVRIISASNADFSRLLAEGRFREDLLFRLNTVELRVPALRERPEDILPLATQFLARHNQRQQRACVLSAAASETLLTYRFPGNIRELSHIIERAVLLSASDTLDVADLGLRAGTGGAQTDSLNLADVEKAAVERALRVADGKVDVAARLLGLSRSALYRRLGRRDDDEPA